MLENLRRKSLVQPYNNPRHKVHIQKGLARYGNHVEIAVCNQRLSKKEAKSSFPKVIDTIPWLRSNMIYCPKGTFIMGNERQADNKPKNKKIDRAFLLGETEVTQELYRAVMGVNPSRFQNNSQNPVEQVSWFDAILFCNRLSELQGLDGCYSSLTDISTIDEDGVDQNRIMSAKVTCNFRKNGYRLPTEKEWEYAAKAGTQNQWVGTDNEEDIGNYAVCKTNSRIEGELQTHPVKSKLPNEWGFYDMSGNVWEWCWDKYDPKDTKPSADRVYRGGGWNNLAFTLRSAFRIGSLPGNRSDTRGFRVCRSIVI